MWSQIRKKKENGEEELKQLADKCDCFSEMTLSLIIDKN